MLRQPGLWVCKMVGFLFAYLSALFELVPFGFSESN